MYMFICTYVITIYSVHVHCNIHTIDNMNTYQQWVWLPDHLFCMALYLHSPQLSPHEILLVEMDAGNF